MIQDRSGPGAVTEHDEKVERIARQLRERKGTQPVSLRKKAVSHVVPKFFDKKRSDDKIDVSDLDRILEIDPVRRICVAEPGVTFVDLVDATMKHGLVPIIVPELKTITIGGAVAGCSIESMSFKYGGFHDTCREYEVITANGDVRTCTPHGESSLLFQMLHGTFGTLGIISKLTFDLIPAKKFVHVVYEKHRDLASYKASIWRHFKDRDVDYVDGIIHSPELYVLSVGRFVDEAPYRHSYDWMRIYWKSTAARAEDYLRTPDYFFRYDKGVTNVHPSSFLGRLLFGKFVSSSEILALAEKLHWLLLPAERPPITLDVFIPFSRVEEFLGWYGREFKFYPLWMVPYRRVRDYEWIAPSVFERCKDDELFLDLAIYGMEQPPDGRNYYRLIEEELLAIGGLKTLISHNHFTEDEFWSLWNRPNYEKAKAAADPRGVFRGLYEKTCR
ncbi:MAG TPA: FAD-binding oxidoreductase [Planctomycetota bacterium]|nr:FAD-binding oxidoreductase [Planctomycetota bacterium]